MKVLRPYQIELRDLSLNDLELDNDLKREVVLGMCPNAGKTTTSISLIKEALDSGKVKKVLVLAHGTTVLRTQYFEKLKEETPDFTFNIIDPKNKDTDAQVLVALPQSLKKVDISDVDLVIVDEAHERYLKAEVQSVIKRVRKPKVLLLTGTPAVFIRENNIKGGQFKLHLHAMSDIDNRFMANVQTFVCSSNHNLRKGDYNREGDVKDTYNFRKNDTKKTLESVVHKVIKVLRAGTPRTSDNIYTLAFRRLKKTMIVARRQTQADDISRILNAQGVTNIVSTQNADPDNENISKFMENDNIQVLIVVNKGILGFDFPALVNVVDLSLTRNINRMYQLFSRITRVHPDIKVKRYFKVASKGETEITDYFTSAMLCLIHRDYLSKFDGKNFKTVLPILFEKQDDEGKKGRKKGGKRVETGNAPKLKKFEGLDVIVEMTRLFNNPDKDLNIYSKISLGDAMSQLTGGLNRWTKETAIEDVKRMVKLGTMTRNEIIAKSGGNHLYWNYRDEFNKLLPSSNTKWTKPTAIKDMKRMIELGTMTRNEIISKCGGNYLYRNYRDEFNKLLPSSNTKWTKPTAIADVKRLIKLGMSRGEITNKVSGRILYDNHRDEFNKLLPSTKTFWTKPTAIKDMKRMIKLGMTRREIKSKGGGGYLYFNYRDEFDKLLPLTEMGRKRAETKARKAAKQKKGKK